MEVRRLGRLGHESSVLIYGAAALGDVDQDAANASIAPRRSPRASTTWTRRPGYGDAELRLGAMMTEPAPEGVPRHQDRRGGTPRAPGPGDQPLAGAAADRPGRPDPAARGGDRDELDKVTMAGGALESAVRAQEEGLVGAVGITGHGARGRRHPPGGPQPLPVRDRADPAQRRAVAGGGLPCGLRGPAQRGAGAQDAGLMTMNPPPAATGPTWPRAARSARPLDLVRADLHGGESGRPSRGCSGTTR